MIVARAQVGFGRSRMHDKPLMIRSSLPSCGQSCIVSGLRCSENGQRSTISYCDNALIFRELPRVDRYSASPDAQILFSRLIPSIAD